jgi:hypothetical protein
MVPRHSIPSMPRHPLQLEVEFPEAAEEAGSDDGEEDGHGRAAVSRLVQLPAPTLLKPIVAIELDFMVSPDLTMQACGEVC